MKLTPGQVFAYACAMRSLSEIGEYLEFTEEDILKPGFGKWMVDYIKQLHTVIGVVKTMNLRKNGNTSIDSHEQNILPPVPTIQINETQPIT